MKALVCRELSGDLGKLGFEHVEFPPLGPTEVRLRIRAASVNFPDLLMVQGKYQHKPELPFIVGGERAGEVIAIGANVLNVKVGDRVIGSGLTGGFAEECQIPGSAVRLIPTGADFAVAAAFTTAYLTASVARG